MTDNNDDLNKTPKDPNRGKIIKKVITVKEIPKEKLLDQQSRYTHEIEKINKLNSEELNEKIIAKKTRIQKNLDKVNRKIKRREEKEEKEGKKENKENKEIKQSEPVQIVKIGGKDIKNPIFIRNTTDPITGKFVKCIYAKKITKLDRIKYDLIWQYYRDRNRQSVEDILKKYIDRDVKITYFGESQVQEITVPKLNPK